MGLQRHLGEEKDVCQNVVDQKELEVNDCPDARLPAGIRSSSVRRCVVYVAVNTLVFSPCLPTGKCRILVFFFYSKMTKLDEARASQFADACFSTKESVF